MKQSPKNWLSRNKITCLSLLNQKALTCLLVFLLCNFGKGQTFTNIVPNGSFETYTNCPNNSSQVFYATPWTGPTMNSSDLYHACANPNSFGVPFWNGISSPYPYYMKAVNNGNGYAAIYFYQLNYREYLEVPLTQTLQTGICYYGEFYVVSAQTTKYYTNNIAGSFGNVKHPTNLSTGNLLSLPQHIINYGNPVIKDTLNWQKVSGLYQANGTESFFTIGNFKDDSNTDTINVYPPSMLWYHTVVNAYSFVDAVSVYSINPTGNLPWSYRDTTVAIGDSVYIGNNMGGNFNPSWFTYSGTFISNGSGIYVKPVTTSTYVVQFTVCGVSRSDTLIVSVTGVGINELNLLSQSTKLYPQPAQDIMNIELGSKMKVPFNKIKFIDNLGRMIREEEITFISNKATINLKDISNGVYFITLRNQSNESITKKMVIAK